MLDQLVSYIAPLLIGGGSVAGWVIARTMQRGATFMQAANVVINGGGGPKPTK
jgi:hypothetical protein